MAENKNILEVHHLKKSFTTGKKSFTAVEDVSFSLKTGEVLGIVGESGSGKSTVAKMITHLTEPTAGEIFLMEKDITHARGKNLREIYRKMQMIFQTPAESFDPRCTLGDGIGESLRNMGISKKENQLSFLFICHDLALVQLFCDRVIVMHDGHVEEEGTPEEIIEHPKTEYTEQLIRSVL